MTRMLLSLLMLASLAGCAAISHPLPKCDGYSRRPLNRSMWQWEGERKMDQSTTGAIAASPLSHVASFAEEKPGAAPAAFEQFDVSGSSRPCEAK